MLRQFRSHKNKFLFIAVAFTKKFDYLFVFISFPAHLGFSNRRDKSLKTVTKMSCPDFEFHLFISEQMCDNVASLPLNVCVNLNGLCMD